MCFSLLSTYVTAQKDWLDGVVLYRSGNYSEAMKILKKNSNHSDAQYYIGLMYQNGEGVERDYKEAAKWFKRAADQGDTSAKVNLRGLYFCGWGVEKNKIM